MSIILDGISKRYGRQLIVDNVSLEVEDGELFVLLGASGSGKSTILRIIAGLTPADTGRVLLHNRDVTHLPPQQRDIGLVFQNYSIFRHMTVAENIEFGLKVRKMRREERTRRRRELLDLVGLISLADRLPAQLSGGQQQRVALARALAYQPKVLLLDEPFGALDVKIRGQLRRSLREIQQRLHVTTILVTHDQEEAFELADRVGVIDKGRLLEVGNSEALYYRPRASFVATFVGGGTLIVGKIRGERACFGHLTLPLPEGFTAEESARVQLLVRPEQVALTTDPQDTPGALLGQGEIKEEYFTGSLRRARLRLPRLPGTRQIAPPLPFGEDSLLVDAVVPASQVLGKRQWNVVLRDWHIIKAPPLRMLIVDTRPEAAPLPAIIPWMIDQLEASATQLSVSEETSIPLPAEVAGEQEVSFRIEQKSRFGNLSDEMFSELGETIYDMAAIACEGSSRSNGRPAGARADVLGRLLRQRGMPVLVVKGEHSSASRMMICTGGGEPGKHDVREGGRLARRLGIPVVLIHVARAGRGIDPLARAHVDRAASTLRSLDLEVSAIIVQSDSIAAAILSRARKDHADLIVMGGHDPRSRFLSDPDITREVIDDTDRPVLVFPVEEMRSVVPDVPFAEIPPGPEEEAP